MRPVKASGWFNSGLGDEDKIILRRSGITPVNDIFYDLWDNKNPINLLFGGYGSGKSVFEQTDLLQKCLQDEYFRGYYGRKVLEDVRGSVHSKFISLIKENHLQDRFKYSEEPNGSMIIRNSINGNMLIPFGASALDGLKSIDDPTHFLMEEMDQFTASDFALILSRLRTTKGSLQLYGSFNTEKVYPGHWILTHFFPEFGLDEELKNEITEIINTVGVYKLFCNYTDNYFIDQQDYFNKLKLASAGDTQLLLARANGAWGSHKPTNPFITQFDQSKHVSSEAVHQQSKPIIISIDFNLNPFCLNFVHVWRDEKGEHCHIFDEMAITAGSIPKIVDQVKLKYGTFLSNCFITGDAMGNRRDISQRDNATYYVQLMRGLNLTSQQMRLPANPTHENSRADCNYTFCHFPDFKIHPRKCARTINDIKMVECDNFNQIIKKNRDKENQQADHLDNVRYLINAFLRPWINNHQRMVKK